ncbi:MAG: ferritin family protein [Thermoguttaceae bacterium]
MTIRAFGWRVFFRAVFKGHGDTFLALLQKEGLFRAITSKEPELIERCVRLELQSAEIYRSLGERLAGESGPLREFLDGLADDEQEHADLLRVCKMFASQGRFVEDRFRPWHEYVPLLEQQMQQAVASLDEVKSIDDMVRLILQVEGSEIDRVFSGVIEATDAPFVKNLEPFRRAVRHHIDYICGRISVLMPSAEAACRELRKKM